MSRCFPFPPPGYEKKPRPDDADFLKKEKHKEKKHKKEKRDREKREGKEKREKDKTDRKHREKKDKKEKHRDKKKDKEKDRDKDKEKGSATEEKRVSGQLDGYNGEKLHQREREQEKEKCSNSGEKSVFGKFQGCNGEKVLQRVEWSKDKSSSDEKKSALPFQGHSGGNPVQNSPLDKETDNSKFVPELCRRIRDEENGTESQLVKKFTDMDWKNDGGIQGFAVRDTNMVVDGKENKDKEVDYRKMDGQRIEHEANGMAQNLTGSIHNNIEKIHRPMDKVEGRTERKGKSKEREGNDKQGGEKRKSKSMEKQSKGKDKDKEKEKKKEERTKDKKEHRKSENDKIKHTYKNGLIGDLNNKIFSSKDGDKNASTEGNLKKRKDTEKNGFFHDNELRPEKMPRLTTLLLSENGTRSEPTQTPFPLASDRQGMANNFKLDHKDRKINGLIGAHPLSVSAPKPSKVIAEETANNLKVDNKDRKINGLISAQPSSVSILNPSHAIAERTANDFKVENKNRKINGLIGAHPSSVLAPKPSHVNAEKIALATRKQPHPDTKYLSKVLQVPQMSEWSDIDDQEWLFSSKVVPVMKPKVGSTGVNEERKVWAEALQIESADVCALPYVIPF